VATSDYLHAMFGGGQRVRLQKTAAGEHELVPPGEVPKDERVVVDRFAFEASDDVVFSFLGKTQENQPVLYRGRFIDTVGGDTGIRDVDLRGEPGEDLRFKVVGDVTAWSVYVEYHVE